MGASVLEKSMVKRLSGTFPQAVFILENKRGGGEGGRQGIQLHKNFLYL